MKKTILGRTSVILAVVGLLGLVDVVQALPGLNGISVHSDLSQDQFIAALYSDTLSTDSRTILLDNGEKVMEIRALKPISARKFNRMWIEGLAINAASNELKRQAQNLVDFSSLMKVRLSPGDILRIERTPGTGTLLSINGLDLGRINDADFFDLLLRTWIGPVPLSSGFKSGLLAGGKIPDELFTRYRSILPSEQRVAALTQALSPGARSSSAPAVQTPVQSASAAASSSLSSTISSTSLASSTASSVASITSSAAAQSSSEPQTLPSEDELFASEDIFDDESGFTFTAESLLSEQLYISKLTKWTGKYVKYPKFAIRNELEGTVRLTVTINRAGRVIDVQYLEKSKHEQLNKAASRAVRSASPFPSMPEEIAGSTFIFTVPVVFRIRVE